MYNPLNLMQMVQEFKANPVKFLLSRKMNIPKEIANDPNAIIQYLLTTGQINQNQINSAYQEIQNGGINQLR